MDIADNLLQCVLYNNPNISENSINDIAALNEYDLLVRFNNGDQVLFDTFSNTSRLIYISKNNPSDEQLRSEFKERLYILMRRKFYSEEELAKDIGSTQQMISRYLTGQSTPNAITLKKIANVLDCSMDDFFYQYF